MAQVGSANVISRNAFSEAVYAKECSSATARSKSCWTIGAHDVENVTVPNFSGGGCECDSCETAAKARANEPAAMATADCFIYAALAELRNSPSRTKLSAVATMASTFDSGVQPSTRRAFSLLILSITGHVSLRRGTAIAFWERADWIAIHPLGAVRKRDRLLRLR
jgi:hypothetical protein